MTDPRTLVDNLRDRVEDSDEIAEADKEALVDFSDTLFLLNSKYSDYRHQKLLGHCVRMAENVGGLSDALEERPAAEDIVQWVNETYSNEETNRDYRVALRVFGKRVAPDDDGDPPPSIDWVPSSTSKNYDPSPDPREMLHWEDEVTDMIDESRNHRDAAMAALQFDAGLRGGEFKDLVVGDLTDHEHGLQVTVDGKQGRRTVTLIPSVGYVQKWLDVHPDDSPDQPLWSKLNQPEPISDRMIKKALDTLASRAAVSKPVTLTNFRKSSAAFLASRGLNQAHIEDHHGWVRGSKVASRYISVFAEDADRELAKVHGIDVSEDEPDPIGPVECPRCEQQTPRSESKCVWCGQAIEHGFVETLSEEQAEQRRALLKFAQDNPDLLDDLERLEPLLAVFDGDTSMIRDAREFADALDGD